MNADSLAKFYETDYRLIYAGNRKATESFFSEQVARGEDILKYVEDCLDMPRNRVIFDIGCGAGGVLLPFQDKGFETYGCDLGGEYLERGKAAGLRLDQGDWSILSRHGKAHLVILNHVLEHLPYPLDMLRRLLELIEEDGYIYIEVPGILYSYKTYGDFLLFLQNAHLYHFTLGTLTDAMKKCGYSLVKGDERIRALYKKNTLTSYEHPESQYLPILLYLITNELFRILGIPRHGLGLRSMVSKVARQLLGDRVVVQLKTLLRNQ
ncbi:MAG: class I SAM-dependent methyltransferase [Cyanobacteriota bacterium]